MSREGKWGRTFGDGGVYLLGGRGIEKRRELESNCRIPIMNYCSEHIVQYSIVKMIDRTLGSKVPYVCSCSISDLSVENTYSGRDEILSLCYIPPSKQSVEPVATGCIPAT